MTAAWCSCGSMAQRNWLGVSAALWVSTTRASAARAAATEASL